MNPLPASAQCRTIGADGGIVTVTATRRERGARADIKCMAGGAPALGERMLTVARLARHTEARFDSREQVVISMDRAPGAHERDWEFAVVLADRMVRGVYQSIEAVCANGWSDHWELGRIDGHQLEYPPAHLSLFLGGASSIAGHAGPHVHIGHLGALTGHPDPAAGVSTARAWFPLHSGGGADALCAVAVSVHPFDHSGEEEDSIAVTGVDMTLQLAVRRALTGARHFDQRGLGRWRTVVQFEQARFNGNSFELALVMADRMARGREFPPRGRLIATGCSHDWQLGRVDAVDGRASKCALILREVVGGDRVLVPRSWEGESGEFGARLRQQGATLACVERIGLI
ncbi:MAG: hypothetical protein V4582_15455 [Pseudomonadota bacterium]